MDDNQTIAISHLSMSGNFLHLVSNILQETITKGNVHLCIGKPRSDIENYYSEQTKWSDFRIMIPTLFLFFHGIELLLKGANYKIALPKKDPDHSLTKLFQNFKESYPSANAMTELLEKYIYPTEINCPLLSRFYSSNNLKDSSKFYELLKYPYSKKLDKYYEHKEIRFLDSEGIPLYKDILSDIDCIRRETAKL
jgi:hypothetical protein